jgi:hypothetical protein
MEYDRKKVIASSAALTIFLAIILFSVASILIGNIKDIVIKESAEEAKGIAATAARFIEDNVSDYRKLSDVTNYSEGSFDKDYYLRMNRLFRLIEKDTGADFIFTEKRSLILRSSTYLTVKTLRLTFFLLSDQGTGCQRKNSKHSMKGSSLPPE